MAEPYRNHSDLGRRPSGDRYGERLVVRSVPVPDPGEDFLGQIPVPAAVAWVRQGAGLAGWGEAARVTLPAGADRFTAGEKWLHEIAESADIDDAVRRRGSGLVAFGTFTFDDASEGSVLVVPEAVLGRDGTGNAWLTTITADGGPHQPTGAWQHRVGEPSVGQPSVGQPSVGQPSVGQPSVGQPSVSQPSVSQPSVSQPYVAPGAIAWHDGSLSAPEWQQAVGEAVRRIKHSARLRKVVLARDLHATADNLIDVRVLLRRLAARYPGCYTFACDGLVGATPELLIARDSWEVSSLVLAGTAPRGATPAQDSDLARGLLGSAKENEEHEYAAVSLRDTLSPLCEAMYVTPRPELIRLPNVQHLGTRVRGTLAAVKSALTLVAAVHPTAAVGGTPTGAAVEVIRELESMDRERYAGPVGWIDADGNGEWGIALRCAQLSGRRARLFAGCGIVAGSEPAAELAETESKFRPMRMALEQDD